MESFLVWKQFVHGSWFMVHGSSSWCGGVLVRVKKLFVRRRVGVGAFGCGSACAKGTRAARIRGADGTKGSPLFISFHLGFCVCVCVCV